MKVVVLTQANCAFCEQAQAMLARLSVDFGFSVSGMDFNSPEGASLAELGGILFPPGIFFDGEAVSYGRPSERRLRRELARRLGPPGP